MDVNKLTGKVSATAPTSTSATAPVGAIKSGIQGSTVLAPEKVDVVVSGTVVAPSTPEVPAVEKVNPFAATHLPLKQEYRVLSHPHIFKSLTPPLAPNKEGIYVPRNDADIKELDYQVSKGVIAFS